MAYDRVRLANFLVGRESVHDVTEEELAAYPIVPIKNTMLLVLALVTASEDGLVTVVDIEKPFVTCAPMPVPPNAASS